MTMSFHFSSSLIIISTLTVFLCDSPMPKQPSIRDISFFQDMILCSGKPADEAKCVGSPYCRACKTCNYCAYCSGGGTCGVCSNKRSRLYTPPSPPSYQSQERENIKVVPSYNSTRSAPPVPKKEIIPESGISHDSNRADIKRYSVTTATSLRQAADSQSTVLKRIAFGDELLLIDCSHKYWCKVIHNGKTGWVKKQLLVEIRP